MTVFLTGLMQKAYSSMDLISLGVELYGIFVTCQNTALTLLVTMGFVKGGNFYGSYPTGGRRIRDVDSP